MLTSNTWIVHVIFIRFVYTHSHTEKNYPEEWEKLGRKGGEDSEEYVGATHFQVKRQRQERWGHQPPRHAGMLARVWTWG